MQILVDADACPVKQIIVRPAKQRNIPVTMLIDTSHELNDSYSTVITVDSVRKKIAASRIRNVRNASAGGSIKTACCGRLLMIYFFRLHKYTMI